jgi:hypothetical protein
MPGIDPMSSTAVRSSMNAQVCKFRNELRMVELVLLPPPLVGKSRAAPAQVLAYFSEMTTIS